MDRKRQLEHPGWTRNLIEAGPLYAGESVARIGDIRPAGALVSELAAGAGKAT